MLLPVSLNSHGFSSMKTICTSKVMWTPGDMSPPPRPLWLSPRQVMVVPVNPSCEDYAKKVSPPVVA